MISGITETAGVGCSRPGSPDDVFVCCASFEERCLGSLHRFSDDYRFRHGYLFIYDRPSEKRQRNLEEMKGILDSRGHLEIVESYEDNPIPSIARLRERIASLSLNARKNTITVDTSTFTKRHLLLLLRMIDDLELWQALRIFYTEPKDYITDLYLPMSFGIREIAAIPSFSGTQPLNKPILLVILLGYEGDRAMALFQNLDPNETILIVPKPAYHSEWEGRTEEMNRPLISLLGNEHIEYAHSRSPSEVASMLSTVLEKRYNLVDWNCLVSPLGTKPQAVGLYLFWRKHRGEFSIVYAQSLQHNERYYSTGVGTTWQLGLAAEK